jgi:hypothetical protein
MTALDCLSHPWLLSVNNDSKNIKNNFQKTNTEKNLNSKMCLKKNNNNNNNDYQNDKKHGSFEDETEVIYNEHEKKIKSHADSEIKTKSNSV